MTSAAEDARRSDNRGATPLLKACSYGHLGVCEWLVEGGKSTAGDMRAADVTSKTDVTLLVLDRENFQQARLAGSTYRGSTT